MNDRKQRFWNQNGWGKKGTDSLDQKFSSLKFYLVSSLVFLDLGVVDRKGRTRIVIGIDNERTTAIIALFRNKIILNHSGRMNRFIYSHLHRTRSISTVLRFNLLDEGVKRNIRRPLPWLSKRSRIDRTCACPSAAATAVDQDARRGG